MKSRLHFIGTIMDERNRDIIGIRILNSDTGEVMDVQNVKLKYLGEPIDGLKVTNNEFNSTRGRITQFPKIQNGQLIGNGCLIVLKKTGNEIAVCNWKGQTVTGQVKDAIGAIKKYGLANGKVVGDDVVSHSIEFSSFREEIKPSLIEKPKEVNKVEKALQKKIIGGKKYTGLYIQSRDGALDRMSKTIMCNVDGVEMTLEQKMAKASMMLREIAPFTHSMLSVIRIIEKPNIKTAGVTLDTMYFNPNFFARLPLKELIFVYMHEMNHILMQHKLREKNRRHRTWNKACDAYINGLLGENFSNIFTCEQMKQSGYVVIDGLDLVTETPEKIYAQMIEEQEERSKDNNNGQGGPSNDDTGDDEEGEDAGADDGADGADDGSENDNGAGDGDGESEEDGEGDDSEGTSRNGGGKGNGKKGKGKNSSVDQSDDGIDTYKGKQLGGGNEEDGDGDGDLFEDEVSAGMSRETMEQRSKAMVSKAKVFNDTMNDKKVGNGEGGLLREIEKAMAPKIDWRSIVRQKLTAANRTDTSFNSPDRRFLSTNTILPGPRKIEPNTIADVFICIDTSGSISDKELGIFFRMLQDLLNKFHCVGEIVYWGTKIEAVYKYKDWKEALKAKPVGGGGTEVNCVFEYFEGRDFKTRKKKKPKLIIIATDGYIGSVNPKYKKWKNETIWLLDKSNLERFKAEFGRVAPIVMED